MHKSFWIAMAVTVLALSSYITYDLITEHPKYQFTKAQGVITASTCRRFSNEWEEGIVDHVKVQLQVDGHNETFRERETYYIAGVDACLYKVGDPVSVCVLHYEGEFVAAGLTCSFKKYDGYVARFGMISLIIIFVTGVPGLYIFAHKEVRA
jgi:hypothetical protein